MKVIVKCIQLVRVIKTVRLSLCLIKNTQVYVWRHERITLPFLTLEDRRMYVRCQIHIPVDVNHVKNSQCPSSRQTGWIPEPMWTV
jgi:hypothetical protein